MKARINYGRVAPGLYEAMDAIDHVADETFEQVRPQFSEKELADLTLTIAGINAWNRLSIAARLTPGTYQPASSSAGS